ncbi:unnamed protein product [Trichobilharzia regenti]|nr:unnamed protein product [Trichobilharzia regenti]
MAFRSADSQLSTVSFRGDGPDSEVNGVNLVLAFRKLDYMYAPHPITFILDFVRGCYNSIAGEHRNNTFISIMRYGDDETITRGLISATSERFLRHKTLGSHHYLWEKRSTSVSFYSRIE